MLCSHPGETPDSGFTPLVRVPGCVVHRRDRCAEERRLAREGAVNLLKRHIEFLNLSHPRCLEAAAINQAICVWPLSTG